jgi:hypothetical protein
MTRRVTVHLDKFGQRSLERLVEGGGGTSATAFRTAALYYLAQRGDGARPSWRAPRFRQSPQRPPGLRVVFDDDTWDALDEEADRQGVPTEELAVHALIYFLADFDRGAVADALRDSLHGDR